MLVLTRRVGEQVVIGRAVRVTVVAIKGGKVRLGVTAPESVRVDRLEVRDRAEAPGGPRAGLPFPSRPPSGDSLMRTVQQGDRVQVHYEKRFQDGSVASSRSGGHAPLELTVGTDHPRLPGLGLGLVGSAPGGHVMLTVPAGQAHGPPDPGRIRRLARTRFPGQEPPAVGERVPVLDRLGRRRRVRVVEVLDRVVVVDTNHPRAGQALELDVEVVSILAPGADPAPEL